MTLKFRSISAAAILAAFLMTAAGCGNPSNPTATTSVDNSTPPSSSGATATTATTATTASNAAPSAMPTECQAYLNAVQVCLDHVSAQNPAAVTQVRETLDVNGAAIERLSHLGSPLEYCVSATNAWESRRGDFGC